MYLRTQEEIDMDMNDIDGQIEELEISIDQAKEIIDKADTLIRLSKTADFRSVITDGYFIDEASRVVLSKSQPGMESADIQKDMDNAIIAIGYLKRHFNGIIVMGNMARKTLQESEETREEILKEASQ